MSNFIYKYLVHKAIRSKFSIKNIEIILVPRAGLEPARGCPRGILNPLCLPIPPPGQRRDDYIAFKQ